ncbi:MAG: hypothetical protein GY749_22775 [Desulfobacteraceae bacterium]|nr:hypothetical protein [Desulfobacteraceae bacterium]
MCFQKVLRKIRKTVDDTTGYTAQKEAASDDRRAQRVAATDLAAAAAKSAAETGVVGNRDDSSAINRRTKAKTRRSRGFKRNIFTSLLGDSGFGKSIKSALKLGQTS